MPFKERHQYLQSDYGFNCSCSLCKASKVERATSDRYRAELEALRDTIDTALTQRRWPDAAQYASEAVQKLSEAEVLAPGVIDYSLTPLYTEHYEQLMRCYYKMGDLTMAKEYGQKAIEAIFHLDGADSFDAEILRGFVNDLTTLSEGTSP